MNTLQTSKTSPTRRGFSMIEMLGVVAVMILLMLAILPALLKEMDRIAREKEAVTLRTMSDGLQNYIVTHRRIPSNDTFAQDLAAQLGWLVADVSLNARQNPRYYLVDPTLRLGTNYARGLTYAQTVLGSVPPTTTTNTPRVMMISSLGASLPSVINNSVTPEVFNQLWNASDYSAPVGWTYGGNWPDIVVQRLNLDPLFVQVILNNSSPTMGHYSIDNTNSHIALPTAPFAAYFIRGTMLGLHATDGTLQAIQLLQDPVSFVYDNGVWRGKLFMTIGAHRHTGEDLQAAYDIFMAGPANPNAKFGVTQAQVTTDMYNYMSNYVVWATNGFSSSLQGRVSSWQDAMAGDTKNYVYKAGK